MGVVIVVLAVRMNLHKIKVRHLDDLHKDERKMAAIHPTKPKNGEPSKDEPSKDEPSKDEPSKDEPSKDGPAQQQRPITSEEPPRNIQEVDRNSIATQSNTGPIEKTHESAIVGAAG